MKSTIPATLAVSIVSAVAFANSVAAQSTPPAAAPRAAFSDAAGANLPFQKIGPNDLISVSVYDAPEFSRTVRVDSNGQITLPMMKHPISAADLLPAELEARIAVALRTEDLLTDPSVVVTITEYQSRPVTVTGAVHNPITFQAVGQVTLMDALTRAGGLAPEAGPEIMVLSSQSSNGLIRRVPQKPLLDGTDPRLNLVLSGGDEVRVPVAEHISVLGNVKTTGSFPIHDKADTTVIGALIMAGGFAGPIPKDAYIIRLDDATQTKHPIQIRMQDLINHKIPDVALVAHDVLFVPNNRRADTLEAIAKIVGVAGGAAILVNVAK